jgi:hypothetical protein
MYKGAQTQRCWKAVGLSDHQSRLGEVRVNILEWSNAAYGRVCVIYVCIFKSFGIRNDLSVWHKVLRARMKLNYLHEGLYHYYHRAKLTFFRCQTKASFGKGVAGIIAHTGLKR